MRLLFVLVPLFLAACDKPFEPLAPTDLVFSIYGHLEATADTQWVRVMPLRESTEMPSGPIDAIVTLEEIETGTRVIMSDSLSRFLPVFIDDAELFAHNFFTTMPVVPGRHYRLTVTRSDGATATAAAMIPFFDDPALEVRYSFRFPHLPGDPRMWDARGKLRGTRHLAMVLGWERVPASCSPTYRNHQEYLPVLRPATTAEDFHDVQLDWESSARPAWVGGRLACDFEPKRVHAVGSGEAWPIRTETQLRDLGHLSSFSNIEGRGVGYLAGVHTVSFPFARCTPIDRTNPCTINFDARSATLSGKVTNRCTGEPVDSVKVEFLSPSANAIRSDTTDLYGLFEFQGLEPGLPLSLTLQYVVQPRPFELPKFQSAGLEVAGIPEGSTDSVSVELTTVIPCGR